MNDHVARRRAHQVGLAIAVLLLSLAIAGCLGSGGGPESPTSSSPDDATSADASGNVSAAPAETEHVHDRWDGETEKVLLDETYTTRTRTDVDPDQPLVDLASELTFGPDEVPFRLSEGTIVPPGTDKVVVEASWPEEQAPQAERQASLAYRTADRRQEQTTERTGTPANWTIDTSVEDADGGHAKFSVWTFRIELRTVPAGGMLGPAPSTEGGLDVDVKVTAHRVNGSLPKEPAHPEWYGNASKVDIYNNTGSAEAAGAWYWQVGPDGSFFPAGEYVNGSEHRIVPPGTKLLVAEINWSNASPTAAAGGVEPYLQWNNGQPFDWTKWEADESGDGYRRYLLEVEPGMTDGLYPGTSRWRFRYSLSGQDPGVDEPVTGTDPRAPHHFDGSWSFSIDAYDQTDIPQ